MKWNKSILFFYAALIVSCSNGKGVERAKKENIKIPAEAVYPLKNSEDLDVLIQEIGDREIVLLGESSHGTSEFYALRANLTKRLITEKGFRLIGVEADWADVYPLNNYIRGNSSYPSAEVALKNFNRWPEWMWANEEINRFAEWLKIFNSGKVPTEKVGFYGVDVYGIWKSLHIVHRYLQDTDPETAKVSAKVLNCFAPYKNNEWLYAKAAQDSTKSCADELAELHQILEEHMLLNATSEPAFNALQNMFVVVNAENYFRTAVVDDALSWNIRDIHMTGTIQRMINQFKPDVKIVVWAHNTHVGDARATVMTDAGMVNVGQLVREKFGKENVYIVGFGTYSGKVIAAPGWGSPLQKMNVPQAKKNSWEWILHNTYPEDKIILLRYLNDMRNYTQRIGHRAIGVVYTPEHDERNYVPSVLPERYNAFIFFDKTTPLIPLD